jgi:hypothetical protein
MKVEVPALEAPAPAVALGTVSSDRSSLLCQLTLRVQIVAAMLLRRADGRETNLSGRVDEPMVVGDDRPQVSSQEASAGEVDRVEGEETWRQEGARGVEHPRCSGRCCSIAD